ncbi:hypothetical protein [Bradyrhizobium sp. USDA 10063]
MAKGFLRIYRTYNPLGGRNPVIDKVKTLVEDEGLIKKLGIVHEISGVSTSTLNNWFKGETRSPQHATIAAVITSLGYQEQFVKQKDIDIEKEREVAAKWQEKAKLRENAKTNGLSKPRKKK